MGGFEFVALLVAVGAAAVACLVAGYSVLRTLIPPQIRQVNELRARVEDVEEDTDRVHARLNERAARENMNKARSTKAEKRELEEQAAALLKGKGEASTPPEASPDALEAQRVQLRRRFLQ